MMPELKIGNLVASVPILQGGMGVAVSLSGLASAVANEGAIGTIAGAGIGGTLSNSVGQFHDNNDEALGIEIRRTRKLTDGIIAVNIMLALTDCTELILSSVDAGADIITFSAGLPMRMHPSVTRAIVEKSNVSFLLKISSARAVRLVFEYWLRHYKRVPDGVVLEGPLAGGHLGFSRSDLEGSPPLLEDILAETIPIVRHYEKLTGQEVPIIAGGGVYTGQDMYRILQLGAAGVIMATRFVTTHECDAHINFKNAYLASSKQDMVIIDSPVGLPGRAIESSFLRDVTSGKRVPTMCSWQCLKTCDVHTAPYCIARALLNARDGNLDEGFAFAGANAYRCKEIVSVKQVFHDIAQEYAAAEAAASCPKNSCNKCEMEKA